VLYVNPIVGMMKRYINMPLKKALPLLFIGALLLVVATAGCEAFEVPVIRPSEIYKGYTILGKNEVLHRGLLGLEDWTTQTTSVSAGSQSAICKKDFDRNGQLVDIYTQYTDNGTVKTNMQHFDPAIDDPMPAFIPIEHIIDKWTATTSPTSMEQPTAVPTEQPTAVPTEQPTAVPTEQPTAVPTEEPNDNIAPYVPFGTNFSSGHAYLGAGHTCLAFI
jgi:hypothetical protein